MLYAVGDVQHMGKRHLCNAVGAICWNVGHHDATSARFFNVDDVIARGQYSNIFELG